MTYLRSLYINPLIECAKSIQLFIPLFLASGGTKVALRVV